MRALNTNAVNVKAQLPVISYNLFSNLVKSNRLFKTMASLWGWKS
jgi:hypothetical protein